MAGGLVKRRRARLAEAVGAFQYYKGKSALIIESVRGWVTPSAATGAFTKYLGFETSTAILAAVIVAPVVECLGFLLGRFMWRHGGVEKEYELSLLRDPYKRRSLDLLEQIRDELRREDEERAERRTAIDAHLRTLRAGDDP